jgi:hypothetical protein
VAAEPIYKDEQEEGLSVKGESVNCCLARSWGLHIEMFFLAVGIE